MSESVAATNNFPIEQPWHIEVPQPSPGLEVVEAVERELYHEFQAVSVGRYGHRWIGRVRSS